MSQETYIVDNDLALAEQDNVDGIGSAFRGQRVGTIVLSLYKGKDGKLVEVQTSTKRERHGGDTVLSETKRTLSPQEAKLRFSALGFKDPESV